MCGVVTSGDVLALGQELRIPLQRVQQRAHQRGGALDQVQHLDVADAEQWRGGGRGRLVSQRGHA